MKKLDHFDALEILSYNAIFNFINSNRNYGKTWCFKRRAFKRGQKRGKITVWVRRFKEEAKEAAQSFYTSRDLQRFCGVEMYDPETKQGNCKQIGRSFYVKRGKEWKLFLKVVYLSQANAMRGVDDVDLDTIVFDEYRTTPEKYALYRGNEVDHFIDMFFSVKREHQVRCFFLGNKEADIQPFATYFGMPPLPDTWEGIQTYRSGSIAVQQINNKPVEESDYDKKTHALFEGTKYGNYIYKDATKTGVSVKVKRPSSNTMLYVQLKLKGQYIRIVTDGASYYVCKGYDASRAVYCDVAENTPKHLLLTKRLKRYFTSLETALTISNVYYESRPMYEAILPFYRWLNII